MPKPKNAAKSADWPRRVVAGSVTVKVYRTSKSTAASGYEYTVSWNTLNGRKRRSFSNEVQAIDEARKVALDLSNGRSGAAQMSNADRNELLAARELAGSTPLLSALREWARARELTRGNLLPTIEQLTSHGKALAKPISVSAAIDRYLRARATDGIKVERGASQVFAPRRRTAQPMFREVFGDRMLADVTTNELAAWLEGFPNPVTRNTHRKRIVAFWNWCRKRGLLPEGMTTAAERTDRAKEPSNKIEVVSAADLRRAFDIVSREYPQYLAAFALSAFCGMRRLEVHGQTWDDIDLKRGFLRITSAKPGTPARRQVPICSTARAWLAPHAQKSDPVCRVLSLDRAKKACKDAGLALPHNGFRHTWISARAELTGDLPRTALEAGTSVDIIHKHYRQLLTREEAEAWFAVLPAQ